MALCVCVCVSVCLCAYWGCLKTRALGVDDMPVWMCVCVCVCLNDHVRVASSSRATV
jgi:hypothetical protein